MALQVAHALEKHLHGQLWAIALAKPEPSCNCHGMSWDVMGISVYLPQVPGERVMLQAAGYWASKAQPPPTRFARPPSKKRQTQMRSDRATLHMSSCWPSDLSLRLCRPLCTKQSGISSGSTDMQQTKSNSNGHTFLQSHLSPAPRGSNKPRLPMATARASDGDVGTLSPDKESCPALPLIYEAHFMLFCA